MSRRIVLQTGIDDAEILVESLADNESQLQELVKDNPDLMPVDDLGLTGPLLVIGKETALPAGSADLIALSQEGSLILVEFKTGPNNSDFRAAIAQLLDYGAGLYSEDADTTGAIYGQIAGACYGVEDIPLEWQRRLAMRADIEFLADSLFERRNRFITQQCAAELQSSS